jgi:hypothetical protein
MDITMAQAASLNNALLRIAGPTSKRRRHLPTVLASFVVPSAFSRPCQSGPKTRCPCRRSPGQVAGVRPNVGSARTITIRSRLVSRP